MADTAVPITAGSGTNIDTRTEATNGNHRQVIVIGDQSTNDAIAPVSLAGGLTVTVANASAATATLANVAGSATTVTLQASNANRRGLDVFNDSTARLYVKHGTTASTTSFTYYLDEGESRRETLYTGIVTGIWASATGSARMTEYTA